MLPLFTCPVLWACLHSITKCSVDFCASVPVFTLGLDLQFLSPPISPVHIQTFFQFQFSVRGVFLRFTPGRINPALICPSLSVAVFIYSSIKQMFIGSSLCSRCDSDPQTKVSAFKLGRSQVLSLAICISVIQLTKPF